MSIDSPASRQKSPSRRSDSSSGDRSAKTASPESNIKDTVESILVAFILAFIFRAFIVEAFVIPTGSMAPTLMGAHMRFRCPDCGFRFDVNFSPNRVNGDDLQIPDYATTADGTHIIYNGVMSNNLLHCPNCGYQVPVSNPQDPDNDATAPPVYYGDRILVLKYLYLFQAPHRWDTVVFKSPSEKARNYSENYIKRLVGLPGETIMILDGDVYAKGTGATEYTIQRKPYPVQEDLWRSVCDNDFIPQGLPRDAGWTQPWIPDGSKTWAVKDASGRPSRVFNFQSQDGAGALKFDAAVNPDTHALTDWMAYDQVGDNRAWNPVSDLKLGCYYERRAGDGAFSLELTKGPDVFTAEITRGKARLLQSHGGATPLELFSKPVADLENSKPAKIEFANCDYRVWLRVNGKIIFETTDSQYQPDWRKLLDDWTEHREAPQPTVRILADRQDCRVDHLNLSRDIYYQNRGRRNPPQSGPLWGGPERPIDLRLDPKEYFVLGDNSPISADARMWSDPVDLPAELLHVESGRVPQQFMLGKAFFVYWPAGYRPFSKAFGKDQPWADPGIIPNFGDMRFIH